MTGINSVLWLCVSAVLLSACGHQETAPPATLVAFAQSPTACAQVEILPTITEIRPEELRPGSEVVVVARGGYLQDDCGGVNESARVYQIYLDDEPVGDLSCYINHCEGKFLLARSAIAGKHCLGVMKGTCQVELEVAGE